MFQSSEHFTDIFVWVKWKTSTQSHFYCNANTTRILLHLVIPTYDNVEAACQAWHVLKSEDSWDTKKIGKCKFNLTKRLEKIISKLFLKIPISVSFKLFSWKPRLMFGLVIIQKRPVLDSSFIVITNCVWKSFTF